MSETEEKRGILGRVKDVFFEAPPPKEPAPEEDGSPATEAPQTAPPVDAAAVAGASDFSDAYARITGSGDPKTDQVLAAFVDMTSKGLDGQPLATAMTAMIGAFGADANAIAAAVAERRQAIASAVEAQRSAMQGRVAEMRTRSEAVVAAAEDEIGELEQRIKDLRGQVAEAQVTVQRADASEQTTFAAFERQATQKKDELNAFAEFLAGTTTAA